MASVVILKLSEEPAARPIASQGKVLTASSEHPDHPAAYAGDGSGHHIWAAADTSGKSYLEIDLGEPTWIHATGLDEPDRWPRYRQHLRMEAETDQGWMEIFSAETRGHGQVRKFDPVKARRVRMYIERAEGTPGIAEWQLYAPE